MRYARFQLYNCVGGITWVAVFVWGGYLFGNIPIVKNNFGVVTILIIVASLVPIALGLLRREPAR
jgi:membrane-associated protein